MVTPLPRSCTEGLLINYGTVPHAVFVSNRRSSQVKISHYREGEWLSSARFDYVVVHDDERMKPVVFWIVVVGEGKSEPCVKPTVFCLAPFLAWSLSDYHINIVDEWKTSSKLVVEFRLSQSNIFILSMLCFAFRSGGLKKSEAFGVIFKFFG